MTELEREIMLTLRQLNKENTVKALAYLEVLSGMQGTRAADPETEAAVL